MLNNHLLEEAKKIKVELSKLRTKEENDLWSSLPFQDADTSYKTLIKTEKFITPIPYIVENPETTPKKPNHLRFVCISDTHNHHNHLLKDCPAGDVLIHTGDFTGVGRKEEMESFEKFLDEAPFKYKVIIAGNHDICMDKEFYNEWYKRFSHKEKVNSDEEIKKIESKCFYLKDKEINIEGIRIYGSPYQPYFFNWAFNLQRGPELSFEWNKIPINIDILLTHGPPIGRGDITGGSSHQGDVDLLEHIKYRVHPIIHIFGHFHEGHGISYDGSCVYINSSIVDDRYIVNYKPIVFDYPIGGRGGGGK